MNLLKILIITVLALFITACGSANIIEDYSSINITSTLNDSLLTVLKASDKIDDVTSKLNQLPIAVNNSSSKEKFILEIIDWLYVPYKYAKSTKRGVDCTGFTQAVYRNALEINLSRSALSQSKEGIRIAKLDNLEFGDLVFFDTDQRTNPGHAGIYIGQSDFKNSKAIFVHAGSKGVTLAKLGINYWSSRFVGGRRIEEAHKKLNKK